MADDGEKNNPSRVDELNQKMEKILNLLEQKGVGASPPSSSDSFQEQKKIHDEDFKALKQEIFDVHDEKNRQIHVKIDEVSDRLKNKIDSVLTEARKETRDQVSTQITFFLNAFKITGTILSFFVLVLGIWGFKTFTDIRERSVNEAVEIMKKQSPELKYEQAMDKLFKQGLVDSVLLRIARKEVSRSSAIDIDGVEIDQLLAIVNDFTTDKKRDYREEKLFTMSLLALSYIYKDKDPITKKRICESLYSSIGNNKSVEWLNDNEEVVSAVIEFLGYMEYSKPAKEIESLIDKKDVRDSIKDASIFYVGLVGYEGNIRDLITIYRSKDSSSSRSEKALWVLAKIYPEYIQENVIKKLTADNGVFGNLNGLSVIVSAVAEGNPKFIKESRLYKGNKEEDRKLRMNLLEEILEKFVEQCKPDYEFLKVDNEIKIITDPETENEKTFYVPKTFILHKYSVDLIRTLLEKFIHNEDKTKLTKLLKVVESCGFENFDIKMLGDSEIRCYTNVSKWHVGEEVVLRPGEIEDDSITINFYSTENLVYIPFRNYIYVNWWYKGNNKSSRGVIPVNDDMSVDKQYFTGSSMFRSTDKTDYLSLAAKLQSPETEAHKIIYNNLDEESKALIHDLRPGDHLKEKQVKVMAAGLNRVLKRADLAEVVKIDPSKLKEEDKGLLVKNKNELTLRQLCRRNRLAMKALFPKDIEESKSFEFFVPEAQ